MVPLAKRTHKPQWFTRKFHTTREQGHESKKIWEAFLTQKLLSTRLGTSKENVKIVYYQSNRVSRQFGISQTMPKPFFNRKIVEHSKRTRDVAKGKVALRKPIFEATPKKFTQTEDTIANGEAAEVEIEPIHVEDSSPEPPTKKKKPKATRVCTRKIAPSPKVALTPKTKKEKIITLDKGDKTTKTSRKLVSNESAYSSPDAYAKM
ncbi:hypothetical protein KIW84_073649 [Lathyrus oleraceus]|uniref:Uncharacterized protein n=1 Tax=Pisum sativum TaxID=3888 RepID=A0A9D4VPT4_PEA|nr:hypothetical protein KIW84_073649 [Pisum sativum]